MASSSRLCRQQQQQPLPLSAPALPPQQQTDRVPAAAKKRLPQDNGLSQQFNFLHACYTACHGPGTMDGQGRSNQRHLPFLELCHLQMRNPVCQEARTEEEDVDEPMASEEHTCPNCSHVHSHSL